MSHASEHDESAVVELGRQLTATWNAGDAAGYGALFTEDATYVVFNGTLLRGRDQIEAAHRELFETALKGSRLVGGGADGVEALRFLRPDVAHLVVTGGMVMPGEEVADPGHDSIISLVAVRQDDGWRLAAFQNTRRQQIPGRPDAASATQAGVPGRAPAGEPRGRR